MNEITKRIEKSHKGKMFFISDFSDICDDGKAVSRALSVMEKRGLIVRLSNGIYLYPQKTRFGIIYPSVDEMVKTIARRDKAQVQPCGATALNKLGLSTQVPTKYTYLTSGSARILNIGNRTIEMKRSVPKYFAFNTLLAMTLVQAFRALGQKNIGEQELAITRKLIAKEKRLDLFMRDISLMPAWMRRIVTNIINNIK